MGEILKVSSAGALSKHGKVHVRFNGLVTPNGSTLNIKTPKIKFETGESRTLDIMANSIKLIAAFAMITAQSPAEAARDENIALNSNIQYYKELKEPNVEDCVFGRQFLNFFRIKATM